MTKKITVRGNPINLVEIKGEKYFSLTDMTSNFEEGFALIEKWLRNKNTIEFLGTWGNYGTKFLNPSNSRDLKKKLQYRK